MPNQAPTQKKGRIVFVTGPSGGGRSTAVKALEDIGFEAIDNLPLSLFPRLLDGPPLDRPMALGIDVRNRDFSVNGFGEALDQIELNEAVTYDLLYLDCSVDVLIRRFSETRRPHPLAVDESAVAGIERELELLGPIRDRASVLIDTSDLSPHDLRAELEGWFSGEDAHHMTLSVQSFSYKRGIPRGVDLVFDVRFLQNPHWQPHLRALTGQSAEVAAFVAADPRFGGFFEKVRDLVLSLLPAFREEGKSYLTIAFGCTGGKHRSVAVAESLAKALEAANWPVSLRHREIERSATLQAAGAREKDGD